MPDSLWFLDKWSFWTQCHGGGWFRKYFPLTLGRFLGSMLILEGVLEYPLRPQNSNQKNPALPSGHWTTYYKGRFGLTNGPAKVRCQCQETLLKDTAMQTDGNWSEMAAEKLRQEKKKKRRAASAKEPWFFQRRGPGPLCRLVVWGTNSTLIAIFKCNGFQKQWFSLSLSFFWRMGDFFEELIIHHLQGLSWGILGGCLKIVSTTPLTSTGRFWNTFR